jgi:Spy/CpxP family protein refolding chaperone
MIRFAPSRAALIAAAIILQPLAAMAQAPAATSPAPKAAPAAMTDPALPKDAETRLEQHNKMLHDQLGITAEQQPQWDKFTDVMRGNALDMRRVMTERGTKLNTMNAAENMQSFADMSKVHAANMDKAASAFQSLYAALTPQQKAVADRVFRNQAEKRAAKKG